MENKVAVQEVKEDVYESPVVVSGEVMTNQCN